MTQFRELTDRYTLEKILRSSRAGTVLRGTDNRTGQDVVVKLINVTSPPLLVQKAPELEKLGAALESMREPSLPAVADSGFTTDGSAFLVMELLEGKTLDALSGPPQRLIGLLAQALDGLEALARRGIAHQNLSPDNLLVTGAPPAERVKILGLGGALFRTPGPAPAETARFRAPELAGDVSAPPAGPIGSQADARADLFSFAMTACQALGITVAPGEPPSAQMPFALSLELENSEAFRKILERCLRHNPAERPSHQEIRDAFRLALGVPLGAPLAPPPPEPRPAAPKLVIPPPPPRPPEIATPPPAMPALAPPPVLAAVPSPPRPAAPAAPEPAPSALSAPSEDQELLSSIDDDFLNSLSAAPPAAAAADVQAPAAGRVVPFRGAGSAAVAPPPAKTNPLQRPGVLLGLAGVLILAAVGAFWWLSRETPPPAEVAAQAVPPPPPRRPATEVLTEAQQAMAGERWESAFRALGSLNGADQATLTPAGCRALSATEESLVRIGADRLPEILAQGLKKADLGQLRFAAWVAEGQGEATLPEAVRNDLLRGRGLLDLYAAIEEAAARNADTEVLERFAILDKDLPAVSDPEDYREKAAVSLETQAEELARQGKYDEAQARLDSVLRSWPKRQPARERSDLYGRARQLTSAQTALLEKLSTALRRNKPHEGLEMLKGVEPVPHLADQIADLRKQLTEKLQFLDQQPPQIALRDGFFLDYDRGQVVEISFRVTDDYMVRSVKLMARPEGGRMRELPLEQAMGYTAKLPPDFHRNGKVEIYVVATDASGHEGFFGTPSQPKLMQRRQGFNRLVD